MKNSDAGSYGHNSLSKTILNFVVVFFIIENHLGKKDFQEFLSKQMIVYDRKKFKYVFSQKFTYIK